MDHHDWADWSEDDGGLGEHDTADLGTPDHFDGIDGHHVESFDADHDSGHDSGHYDTPPGPQPDLGHGPDLLHESGDLDVPQHDADPGLDHPDPGQHGHYDDPSADEPDHGTGGEHVDHLVGTDPDVDTHHDGVWHDDEFPPQLDLDARPEPADGFPWADPDTLGDPGTVPDADHVEVGLGGGAPAGDLFAYAGLDAAPAGVDPWSLLLGSDDPATSTLARWWGPS